MKTSQFFILASFIYGSQVTSNTMNFVFQIVFAIMAFAFMVFKKD